jgi:uncharacterized protein
MFSLQVIFGKGDRFFELLEASAEAAVASAKALLQLVSESGKSPMSQEFAVARNRERALAEQISKELVDTFVTALEREDIEALNAALYKIPKTVQKFAERYSALSSKLKDVDFAARAAMLERAAQTVAMMVRELRGGMKLDQTKAHFDRLQTIENDADRLINDSYKDLFSGQHEALQVLLLKDMSELMEKAIDRCSEAGKVVYQIVLKNA